MLLYNILVEKRRLGKKEDATLKKKKYISLLVFSVWLFCMSILTFTLHKPADNIQINYNYSLNSIRIYKNIPSIMMRDPIPSSLATPTLISVQATSSGAKIKWKPVANAEGYNIYRKTPNNHWIIIGTITNNKTTCFVDKTVNNSTDYTYSIDAFCKGVRSKFNHSGVSLHFISSPEITIKNKPEGVSISWEKHPTATEYKIFKKTEDSGKWAKIDTVNGDTFSFIDTKAENGEKAYYGVAAVESNGSRSSMEKNKSNIFISAPVIKNYKNTESGIKVYWEKVEGAKKYKLLRKIEGGKWESVKTVSANTFDCTDKDTVLGVEYYYRVKAISDKYSNTSTSITACKVEPPQNINLALTSNGVRITWNGVKNADYYAIYKKNDAGNWVEIHTTRNNSNFAYTDRNIVAGSQYTYTVASWYKNGESVYGSTGETITVNSDFSPVRVVDPSKPMVALTYDDGPSNSATTRILNTLEAYNSRATFFVVGSRVNSYSYQIKRAYDLGCEIGNHTYNHAKITSLTTEELKAELSNTDIRVAAITGVSPVLMRPPGGSYKTDTVRQNTAYPIIMWSVDTLDWKYRNADSVVNSVKGSVFDGSIILMHDLYDSTAEATEIIVPWLIEQGYQLVTVSEMMEARGIAMQNGVAYSSAK